VTGDNTWAAQFSFWRKEYPRRARVRLGEAIPPRVSGSVVRALEARARPRDLDLRNAIPRVREILVQTHALSDPALVVMPPVPPILGEDGFWFPPVKVQHLTGVELDVNSGLVFTRAWVINGSGTGQRWAMDSAFITGASVRVKSGRIHPEPRVVAPLGNVIEHYHFLMETLPQVMRVLQVAPDAVFLTAETPSTFAQTLLSELGARVEVIERDRVLACSSVFYCEGFPRERTHPADMAMLYDTFHVDQGRADGRVYISRAKSMRAVRDEHVLEEALRTRGFTVVYLEELTFAEQVASMAGAGVVVAPHGAGLANTVFMPPGGHVIEITSGEWWSNAFRRIAHARGHSYDLLTVPSGPGARWGAAADLIAGLTPLLDAIDARGASGWSRAGQPL
jgi:hypothetical protein